MSESAAKKPSPSQRRKARYLALQALYQWTMAQDALNAIEAQFLVDANMKKVDGQYFHELLHQIPAHLSELDERLVAYLDRPITQLDPIELNIFRMALYEMQFRIDVPYKVIINEAIELAKIFGATDSHKYINGVLDKVAPTLRTAEVSAHSSSHSAKKVVPKKAH